jgi:excisionase family DNA binding protein
MPARPAKSPESHPSAPLPFGGRLGVSVDETAESLGLNRDTVYVLIETGRLRTSKIGRRRVVHVASILSLLAETAA